MKPRIVVSAVNFFEGGPLSVLQDCLASASEHLSDRYELIALVHDARLLRAPKVRLIEFPSARKSWLRRLHLEFVRFRELSEDLRPYLWLSLHDITPNVTASRRAVYCHNPAPFFKMKLRHALQDPTFALFNLFYGLLYRINIHENTQVVVQQSWMAMEFRRRYHVERIVVAHPTIPPVARPPPGGAPRDGGGESWFVFPTFPRVFKNVEVLGECAKLLLERGRHDVKLVVTIDGTENRYARYIRRKYGHLPGLALIGRRSREEVFALYARAKALLFPSKLETWGMPLSEFQAFGKPIIAADLDYARETVGPYRNVGYFAPDDAESLLDLVLRVASEGSFLEAPAPSSRADAALSGWPALFDTLLQ